MGISLMKKCLSFLFVLSALSGCTVLTSGALQEPGESDGSTDDGGVDPDGSVASCTGVADGTACGGDTDAGPQEDMVCRNGACVIPCGGCIEGLICNTNTWACEPICALQCTLPEVCNPEKRKCEDPCKPDGVAIECDEGDVCIQGECVFDCSDQANGTWCDEEKTELCQDGTCVVDECGNGYVGGTEVCDDGNEDDGDGCSACQPDCTADEECNDGEACNGEEACASGDNGAASCINGDPVGNNQACEHPSGQAATCQTGVCTPAGCGNEVHDTADGEECDITAGVGTEQNCVGCRWVCIPDTEGRGCPQSGDLCKPSICVNNACQEAPVECDPGDVDDASCQESVCVAGKCQVRFKAGVSDVDKDNHSPQCEKLCDCNDNDGATNCSATEFCDGKNVDNDCNAGTTEPGATNYYSDSDKDGYGGAYVANTCMPPAGAVPNANDCWDASAYAEASLVNPKYTRCASKTEHQPMPQATCEKYYTSWLKCLTTYGSDWNAKCTSTYYQDCWDRDCDSKIEPVLPSYCGAHSSKTCADGILTPAGTAVKGNPMPCGAKGTWLPCEWQSLLNTCVTPKDRYGVSTCGANGKASQAQACH